MNHFTVYIRTTPEMAHDRMLNRARGEEVTVNLEYLTQLHRLHETWLLRKVSDIPVFIYSQYYS